MTKRTTGIFMPKFKNESSEADWWASATGRRFVTERSAAARAAGTKVEQSPVLSNLKRKATVQIALRLPQTDLAQARRIAERKGIGYQTLLKMLVRDGLIRESRRAAGN